MCLIPEGRGVFPNLTVRENILMDTFACRRRTSTAELEAVAYARFPRLGERRHQLAGTLSGGEQQMLALARALTTDPARHPPRRAVDGPRADDRRPSSSTSCRAWPPSGVTTVIVEQFAGVTAFADRVRGHGPRAHPARRAAPTRSSDQLASAYLGGDR